jgi:23S rRNA (guanine2535-N1)-methyltransferase
VKYRFAVQRENYEDLSSGRVLYGQPGSTAFPVRIASEIFQRCAERLARLEAPPLYSLYDPCCGSWAQISTRRRWCGRGGTCRC